MPLRPPGVIMGVQYLPMEVTFVIIDELIADIGIGKSWKYRLVCKAFATAIKDNLLLTQTINSLSIWPNRGLLSRLMAPYLEQRLNKPLDYPQLIIRLIKRMTEFLLRTPLSDTAESSGITREKITESLCVLVSSYLADRDLRHFGYNACYLNGCECLEDLLTLSDGAKLAAMIELGWDDAAETALKKNGNKPNSVSSVHLGPQPEIFGRPLFVAAKLEKYRLVGLLLKHGFTDSWWALKSFVAAIERNDFKLTELLISLHEDNEVSIASEFYNGILKAAIESNDTAFVTIVLDIKANTKTKISEDNFKVACRLGHADVIRTLLDRINIRSYNKYDSESSEKDFPSHPSDDLAKFCPLRIAVEAKVSFTILKFVLEHPDADVSGKVRKLGPSPLELAVRSLQSSAVSLLLEKGADPNERCSSKSLLNRPAPQYLPDLDIICLRIYSRKIYNSLREARLRMGQENVPEFKEALLISRKQICLYSFPA